MLNNKHTTTLTFLGTGTSQGVPVISCTCKVCTSINPQDKRLRSSVMFTVNGKNIVIDTGPDFRTQMLRQHVSHIDAILFTHEHKDHIAGLDDVRAFNYIQKQSTQIYATVQVQNALKREFHYAFTDQKYPGVPQIHLNTITNQPFSIGNIKITPIQVWHYKLPVLGFRINDITYITDANKIEPSELEKIKGTNILVLNALRKEKHISHFTLSEALQIITQINPKRAYLTHISHLLGRHNDIQKELPENVFLAYDGLQITI